jgi:hypothetical protein
MVYPSDKPKQPILAKARIGYYIAKGDETTNSG